MFMFLLQVMGIVIDSARGKLYAEPLLSACPPLNGAYGFGGYVSGLLGGIWFWSVGGRLLAFCCRVGVGGASLSGESWGISFLVSGRVWVLCLLMGGCWAIDWKPRDTEPCGLKSRQRHSKYHLRTAHPSRKRAENDPDGLQEKCFIHLI